MRWLIVEDALRDRKGHWLEYVSTFVRELRVLGDEVVVLCDRRAEGFVMEHTGARPVLPESIWHRMGDGAGALKRYLRVPGHAIAIFFAMGKVFREFNHGGHRGHRGFFHGDTAIEAGQCLDKPSGAGFSNPSASKLARDSENTAPTRSASDPALARIVSEDRRLQIGDVGLDAGRSIASAAPATLIRKISQLASPLELPNGSLSQPSPRFRFTLWATLGRLPRATPCAGGLDSGEAPDWIFVPTVLVHHLLGWWLLLKAGSVPKESRVLLFFPNLPIRLDDTGKPHWTGGPTTKLMAWLFERLRGEVENGKVVLGVETHAMRRALEGLICMPVVYLPHPVEAVQPPRTDSGGLRTEGKAETGNAGPGGIGFAFHGARKLKDNLTTNRTELHERGRQGDAQGTCAGAAFSNPSTSKPARDCENTSPTRSASGTAPSNPLPATSASPIVFGCYGAARWEKGSDIFQEAIKLVLRAAERPMADSGLLMAERRVAPEDGRSDIGDRTRHGAGSMERGVEEKPEMLKGCFPAAPRSPLRVPRFAIQWVEDFRDGEGNLVSMDSWLREHPQVEVIGRYFEGDEYGRRLAQTDVMVLPYRKPYGLRVSRVVIEAMLNGMPVIATRGTTLFGQAEEFGVVVGCDDGDAESLAEAMLEVAARFEILHADALGKADGAAAAFSVKCFRDLLVAKKIGGENSLDAVHSLDN